MSANTLGLSGCAQPLPKETMPTACPSCIAAPPESPCKNKIENELIHILQYQSHHQLYHHQPEEIHCQTSVCNLSKCSPSRPALQNTHLSRFRVLHQALLPLVGGLPTMHLLTVDVTRELVAPICHHFGPHSNYTPGYTLLLPFADYAFCILYLELCSFL